MDKELALILAEILIKQDETTAQMKENTAQIQETNHILRDFMGVSVKQCEEQHKFNALIFSEVKAIKETLINLPH